LAPQQVPANFGKNYTPIAADFRETFDASPHGACCTAIHVVFLMG